MLFNDFGSFSVFPKELITLIFSETHFAPNLVAVNGSVKFFIYSEMRKVCADHLPWFGARVSSYEIIKRLHSIHPMMPWWDFIKQLRDVTNCLIPTVIIQEYSQMIITQPFCLDLRVHHILILKHKLFNHEAPMSPYYLCRYITPGNLSRVSTSDLAGPFGVLMINRIHLYYGKEAKCHYIQMILSELENRLNGPEYQKEVRAMQSCYQLLYDQNSPIA